MIENPRESLVELEKANARLYEKKRSFVTDSGKQPFFAYLPPPNITGDLHLGHGLNFIILDTIVRHKKAAGFNVYFPPGTDHAGIMTQFHLRRSQNGKRDVTLEDLRAWRDKVENDLQMQMKQLALDADWDHAWSPLDPHISSKIQDSFITLYKEGRAYRSREIVNWCFNCRSTLPDIGVEFVRNRRTKYDLQLRIGPHTAKCPLWTPEALLGCTAIGIRRSHPEFTRLVNKTVLLPILEKRVQIIEVMERENLERDELTAIIPCYNVDDFKQYGNDSENIYREDGTIHHDVEFRDLSCEEARERIVKKLKENNLISNEKMEEYDQPLCRICGKVLYPRIMLNWYLNIKDSLSATDGKNSSDTICFNKSDWENGYNLWSQRYKRVIPNTWRDGVSLKTYEGYSSNKDMIISCQGLWGQSIPAWSCGKCGGMTVENNFFEHCAYCGSTDLQRDQDVFSLLYSCAVSPVILSPWKDKNICVDFTACGHDIYMYLLPIVNILSKMLLGRNGFGRVIVHGLLVDENGAKMTKSKGNTIKLREYIEQHGIESFRNFVYTTLVRDQDALWIPIDGKKIADSVSETITIYRELRKIQTTDSSGDQPVRRGEKEIKNSLKTVFTALEKYQIGKAYQEMKNIIKLLSRQRSVGKECFSEALAMLSIFHPVIAGALSDQRRTD